MNKKEIKIMHIKVVTHYQKDDVEFYGDYGSIEVFIDDEKKLEFGDGYHDNGQEKVEGGLEFLDVLGIQYTLVKENIADEEW